jgi:hypothetical protein
LSITEPPLQASAGHDLFGLKLPRQFIGLRCITLQVAPATYGCLLAKRSASASKSEEPHSSALVTPSQRQLPCSKLEVQGHHDSNIPENRQRRCCASTCACKVALLASAIAVRLLGRWLRDAKAPELQQATRSQFTEAHK